MNKLFLKLISFYQALPPILGRSCRFTPTCSEYCSWAIEERGILRGSLMGLARVLRCHPWSKGGVDLPSPTTRVFRDKK